ncbi:hypothetical protein NE865_15905 [Phthorimaea operculella]|nr:hypothetical protein NE865_15905 [Phthorimaea operculella]
MWLSFAVIMVATNYAMACCGEKGLCLIEALKEMEECKKGVLSALLKPLLLEKLEKKKDKLCDDKLELPPPPVSIMLTPAAPPPAPLPPAPAPVPMMMMPFPLPPFCLPAPPPPLCLPAPPPLALPPALPPMFLPAPPAAPISWLPPPPPKYLPAPAPAPCAPAPPAMCIATLIFKPFEIPHQVVPEHFAHWYKWLILGDGLPDRIHKTRYDSDITYIRSNQSIFGDTALDITESEEVGYYSPTTYNGSFTDYLSTDVDPERDSAIRCAYLTSSLIIQMLNATEVLLETHFWSKTNSNDSMLSMLQYEVADISGAILRILPNRIEILDYILPIWPFGVGFTYLAERESSTNMYVEPFSAGVWWSCLGIGLILAVAQRVTAKRVEEKEGAFIGVLATWLQQDASAVPEGTSGRWSFLVMSISAMLVHAYYTSAIVSSLMSSGRGGPHSLRGLGDSKYAIASEDYEYMRYLFWEKGVELIKDGSTAFHAEYNNIYPFFNTLSDDQLCKLQYLATIPTVLTWTTATKRGQYTNVFRSRGAWLSETGLAYRIVFRLRMRPPPCRASLLAERVKFGDVAPLLSLTALGALLSFIVLGVEIAYCRAKKKTVFEREATVVGDDEEAKIDQVEAYDYVN